MERLLLRGRPGIGKTTIVKKLAVELKKGNKNIFGFYTEEIREGGIRRGFRVINFGGKDDVMAHIDFKTPHRVSKYGVDLARFERIALPELEKGKREEGIIVIDEIGKMELFSERFREMVKELFLGDKLIIATIPISPLPFIQTLIKMPNTEVIEITISNRERLFEELKRRIISL